MSVKDDVGLALAACALFCFVGFTVIVLFYPELPGNILEYYLTHGDCRVYLAYEDNLVYDSTEWSELSKCPDGYIIREADA